MSRCRSLLLALLAIFSLAACARLTAMTEWVRGIPPKAVEDPMASHGDPAQSDWLIARNGGQWELVSKGAAGRVVKSALNEEVLRIGRNGRVLVLSMPRLEEGEEIHCPATERYDYRALCSSAFLDCKGDSGSLLAVLWGSSRGHSVADSRNRHVCRADENMILTAAKTVGLMASAAPVVTAPPAPRGPRKKP